MELFTSRLEDRLKKRGGGTIFNYDANIIAHHLGKGNQQPSSIHAGHLQNGKGQESGAGPSQESVQWWRAGISAGQRGQGMH